jgi:hypothetical protein
VGHEPPKRYWIVPAILSSCFMGFLAWAILAPNFQMTTMQGLFDTRLDTLGKGVEPLGIQAITADGGAVHIGQLLFTTYLAPFELASILLLLAMIGAIILSKRQLPEEEGEPEGGTRESGGRFIEEGFEGSCSLDDEMVTPVDAHSSADESEKETLGVH